VVHGVAAEPRVRAVLLSPKVTKAQKYALVAAALPEAPGEFVGFLQAVIRRGRQALFGEMVRQYEKLLDVKLERVRAAVTTARPVDEALRRQIAETSPAMGKVPHFTRIPRSRWRDRAGRHRVRRLGRWRTTPRRHLLSR
jgi:hypothetical protein